MRRTPVVVATAWAMAAALSSCASSSGGSNTSLHAGSGSKDSAVAEAVVYPPTTIAEANALGTTGDKSVIHVVRRENRPEGSCQRPNVYATADADVTGQALAAAELATFTDESALSATCPAYLYLFHSTAESEGSGFTAGAVILDDGLLDVYTGDLMAGAHFEIKQ